MKPEEQEALRTLIREELPEAVEVGIKRVLTREVAVQFAEAFVDVMKQQASVKVDSLAGNAVKGLARKVWENAWLVLFFVAVAYAVGGWGAVAGAAKWAITQAVQQ